MAEGTESKGEGQIQAGAPPPAEGAEGAAGASPPASEAGVGTPSQPAASASEEGAPGASPPVETPSSQSASATAATPPKPRDWRDDRIAKLTAQLKEAKAKPAAQPAPAAEGAAPPPGLVPESEVQRRASELAAEQAAANEFNAACTAVADQGRKDFPETFDGRIAELMQLRGDGDLQQQYAYNAFIAAAIETGEGPKILHELGGDLNEAARIMALPPLKMAVALTKRAHAKAEGQDQITRAPKPITPVGGQRASHSAIEPTDPDRADHLSTAEWMKRRQAQVSQRGARR